MFSRLPLSSISCHAQNSTTRTRVTTAFLLFATSGCRWLNIWLVTDPTTFSCLDATHLARAFRCTSESLYFCSLLPNFSSSKIKFYQRRCHLMQSDEKWNKISHHMKQNILWQGNVYTKNYWNILQSRLSMFSDNFIALVV